MKNYKTPVWEKKTNWLDEAFPEYKILNQDPSKGPYSFSTNMHTFLIQHCNDNIVIITEANSQITSKLSDIARLMNDIDPFLLIFTIINNQLRFFQNPLLKRFSMFLERHDYDLNLQEMFVDLRTSFGKPRFRIQSESDKFVFIDKWGYKKNVGNIQDALFLNDHLLLMDNIFKCSFDSMRKLTKGYSEERNTFKTHDLAGNVVTVTGNIEWLNGDGCVRFDVEKNNHDKLNYESENEINIPISRLVSEDIYSVLQKEWKAHLYETRYLSRMHS